MKDPPADGRSNEPPAFTEGLDAFVEAVGRHMGVGLGDLLMNVPMPIWIKDLVGQFIYVNDACLEAVGMSRAEVMGRTDFDLMPSELASKYRRHDLLAVLEGAAVQYEDGVIFDGRERRIATLKFPVADETGVIAVCGVSIDISKDRLSPEPELAKIDQDAYFQRLLSSLTPQEVKVLDLLVEGLSDREIARKLSLADDTVRHHVSRLLKKLHKRRAHAIIEMLRRRQE